MQIWIPEIITESVSVLFDRYEKLKLFSMIIKIGIGKFNVVDLIWMFALGKNEEKI